LLVPVTKIPCTGTIPHIYIGAIGRTATTNLKAFIWVCVPTNKSCPTSWRDPLLVGVTGATVPHIYIGAISSIATTNLKALIWVCVPTNQSRPTWQLPVLIGIPITTIPHVYIGAIVRPATTDLETPSRIRGPPDLQVCLRRLVY
jgi:hypothetical protein